MSVAESRIPKMIAGGEFARVWATAECPWSKPTADSWVVDGLAHWRRDPALEEWLRGEIPPKRKPEARQDILSQWRDRLAVAWDVTAVETGRGGQYRLGEHTLWLRTHWLEITLPLPAPAVAAEALEEWRLAVNGGVYLVAVETGCTHATVRVPIVSPTEADVAAVSGALDYVASELCPILACLHADQTLAAVWQCWLRATVNTAREEVAR